MRITFIKLMVFLTCALLHNQVWSQDEKTDSSTEPNAYKASLTDKQQWFSEARLRVGAWLTDGSDTELIFAAPGDDFAGVPVSQLDYTDLESDVFQFRFDARLFKHYFIELAIGSDSIDNGTLIDRDWFSADFRDLLFGSRQADRSDFLFSSTTSRVEDGDIDAFDIKVGRDLFSTKNKRWTVGAYLAYSSLEEKYVATGIISNGCELSDIICPPPGFDIAAAIDAVGVPAITNTKEYESLIVGLKSRWVLSPKFTLSADFGYLADSDAKFRDVHHLRDDLSKNPSFLTETSADGYNAALDLEYAISKHWSITIGYQIYSRDFDREENILTVFPVDEPASTEGGAQNDYERDGATLSIGYSF